MFNISPLKKLNWIVKGTSLFRVPLLSLCNPKIVSLDPTSIVEIPLNYMTKNHVRTMYFGALAMGAELSVAAPVLNEMFLNKKKVNFIFKDVSCEFLKRADDDVRFECDHVPQALEAIEAALKTKERVNLSCKGKAYSKKNPELIFMTFQITISMKAI